MTDLITDLRDIQRRIKSGGEVSAKEFRVIAEAAREERRTADGKKSSKKAEKKSPITTKTLDELFKDVS